MKKQALILFAASGLVLTACTDRPFLYTNEEADKPAYEQEKAGRSSAESRAPLDVPPQLRNVEVPQPEVIASKDGDSSDTAKVDSSVAGKAVSLDARLYNIDAATVFSSVVDAMTSLNLPVQSVDSPSGTLTTDWIKQGVDNTNYTEGFGLFGGDGVQGVRYRYVIRVLRQTDGGVQQTRLEIRTIGQAFINRHWVNRALQRKVGEDLFDAVEERLAAVMPAQQ